MDEPDWAKILRYLHNHNGEIQSTADEEEPSHEENEQALYKDLRERIDLDNTRDEEIVDTHKHLQNTGLVDFHNSSDYASLSLTPEGLNVAHERELSKRDNRINQSLVFFTFVLVLAQIVGVIPASDIVKILLSFVILGGIFVVTFWTDLLSA